MAEIDKGDIIAAIALLQFVRSLRNGETRNGVGGQRETAFIIRFIGHIYRIIARIAVIYRINTFAGERLIRILLQIPTVVESFRRNELVRRSPTALDTADLPRSTSECEIGVTIVDRGCTSEHRDNHFHLLTVIIHKV